MKKLTSLLLLLLIFTSFACSKAQKRNGTTGPSYPSNVPEEESPTAPVFQPGQVPKIGFILGPGGMKSFAHVGVLREFEKQNIPVHAIVGLEWGSLIAAAYSQKGKANDLEWQLTKLKKNNLPAKGFLGGDLAPTSIRQITPFFDQAFASSQIQNATIKFGCPSMLLKNGKTRIWTNGTYKSALEKCMSFPPYFTSTQGWMAAAFHVEEAAQWLRDQGAEVVIFVNVLARGTVLKEERVKNEDQVQTLWWEGVRQLNSPPRGVNWVIGVHTRNFDILDYDAKESFVIFGQEFGAAAAKKMATEFRL
ncbi:MAG: patatin-like phospholipase family protein [Bdellovibrionales bacterium]